MSWYPDLSTQTIVASGEHVRAVGWLSINHPFPRGDVPAEFVARLRLFVALTVDSAKALGFPAFWGFHKCDLCDQVHDGRNFGVPAGELVFVAPGMVAHYVEQHEYQPPPEFIAAVLESPLPGTVEYRAATAEFRRRNREQW